ncbi:MAG: AzlC family ABC transporter permease [Roseitalea sp.]|jgi:4-azaleucine resistance transporter AzlC|nr:AzlC family ABC transporter permease [Roseitalea sp.]MBO6722557.1 AzlC family ABC transporter permease [Roseitalea sp.]MBO6742331.1 AzlC family ABC transporter permease [Roseitalea sp.]
MTASQPDFWRGVRDAVPILIAVAPFGLLFGALAAENGLTPFEATLMSATVYAGASQMVGIELFGADIAPWIIVFSILAVNFRHVLYSATMGQTIGAYSRAQKALAFALMTDPQFAVTEQKAEKGIATPFAWYLGLALPVYALWVGEAWLGAVFGSLIDDPSNYAIDFLLPLYFLGMVMDFRGRANWLPVVGASALASVAAYHFVGSPWHVSLGGLAGVAVAAMIGVKPGHKLVV